MEGLYEKLAFQLLEFGSGVEGPRSENQAESAGTCTGIVGGCRECSVRTLFHYPRV